MSLTQLQTFATTSDEIDADSRASLRRQVDYVVRNAGTIGDGSIQGGPGGHIAASSITAGSIAAGSITADRIEAGTLTAVQIQARAITADRIQAGSITATEITAGTITGALIKANTIQAKNIATGTLTGDLVAAGTLTGDRLVTDTITATQIVGTTLSGIFADLGTVTAGTLRIGVASGNKVAVGDSIATSTGTKQGVVGTDAANAITFWLDSATGNLELKGTIKSGSTGLGNIAGAIHGTTNIASGTVAGDRLVANSITAGQIDAGSVRSVVLVANSITAGMIQAGQIETAKLAAGAVTADKITLGFGGSNRLKNSNFNNGFTGYQALQATNVAFDSHPSYPGGKEVFATATGATPYILSAMVPVTPGTKITASAYLWNSIAGRTGRVGIEFYDAAQTGLVSQGFLETPLTAGQWNRIRSPALTVASNAVYARLFAMFQNIPSGAVLEWAGFQIEEGEVMSAWGLAPDDIAPGSIGTTHITPGAITTGLLTADWITGKNFRTADTGARIEFDSASLRKYDTGGNVALRITTGDGLDLLAGDFGTPPNDRKVRYLSPVSAGIPVAELQGFDDGTNIATDLHAMHQRGTAGTQTQAILSVFNSNYNRQLGLVVELNSVTGRIRTTHPAWSAPDRTIADHVGGSSFQLAASDRNQKRDIAEIDDGALDRIRGLRPVEFAWRHGEGPVGRQTGLIAQEVAGIIPSAVQILASPDSEPDRYTLQHAALIANLIGAVQAVDRVATEAVTTTELRDVVLDQDATIGRLADRVAALESAAPTANTNPPQ